MPHISQGRAVSAGPRTTIPVHSLPTSAHKPIIFKLSLNIAAIYYLIRSLLWLFEVIVSLCTDFVLDIYMLVMGWMFELVAIVFRRYVNLLFLLYWIIYVNLWNIMAFFFHWIVGVLNFQLFFIPPKWQVNMARLIVSDYLNL